MLLMLKLLPLRLLLSFTVAFVCVFYDTDTGGFSYAIATGAAILGAAGIGAGASLAGGLLGMASTDSANSANVEAARIAARSNEAMFYHNLREQWKMWHVQNSYNAPAEQRKRLLAAGINPALAMENSGSVGQASSMSPPAAPNTPVSAPSIPYDFTPMMQGLRESATMALQYGIQAKQVDADARLKNSQAAINEVDAQTRNALNMASLQKTMNDSKVSIWQRRLAAQQYNFLKSTEQFRINAESYQPDLQRQALAMAQEQTSLYSWQRLSGQLHDMLDIREDSRRSRELDTAITEARARIGLYGAQSRLTDAQASHEAYKEAETILRAVGINENNKHFESTKSLLVTQLKGQIVETSERIKSLEYDRQPGLSKFINLKFSDLPRTNWQLAKDGYNWLRYKF